MTRELAPALDQWLEVLWSQRGSDLFLASGSAPRVRVDGELRPLEGESILESNTIRDVVFAMLDERQRAEFDENGDVDFAFSWGERARVRANAYTQRGEVAAALRIIPAAIPKMEDLGLPEPVTRLVHQPHGLVLVTGPTGSGKSTTLASIIDRINATRAVHILTIEDPVEYVHHHQMAAVTQREVGLDSPSFERALRSALREDPDVLLLGEMRDLESIQIALTMAETGHLVFATLHTNDAAQTMDRIIDVFPSSRQDQIRVQLSASLAAVVGQRLLPRVGGGVVAAFEIMLANTAVRNLVREGRTNQLRNAMTMHRQDGMRLFEESLAALVASGQVTKDDAIAVSANPKDFARALATV